MSWSRGQKDERWWVWGAGIQALLSIIRQVEGTFVAALLITSFHYSAAAPDNTLYLKAS